MRVIIPCAGYGTRMGMDPNKSKELLLDDTGKPIIEWCLNLFSRSQYLLIIREGKQDLIDYCIKNGLLFIVVPPTKEWPDTILQSADYWDTRNLLLLPDTRFEPSFNAKLVPYSLMHNKLVLGIHEVDNISKWGAVKGNSLAEKPDDISPGEAWGFIGFKEEVGRELFSNFLAKGQWMSYNGIYKIKLDSFKDITRGSK